MTGLTDLHVLLRAMSPRLNEGEFVFTSLPSDEVPASAHPVVVVREDEGVTLVLRRAEADELGLPHDLVAAWITLRVRSALVAVGLTAAVSGALADAGISANVVAGRWHDHVFVPHDRADDALDTLTALADDWSA